MKTDIFFYQFARKFPATNKQLMTNLQRQLDPLKLEWIRLFTEVKLVIGRSESWSVEQTSSQIVNFIERNKKGNK